eukprot:CAMPEP_0180564468 /NCGR_PEP_ID=MMETSP1037_2-20121125/5028_1 /TAXON_ID=632150 /ORGANISM="Azadinium spinosum, Strain 3D9" /LENGTH=52 /DNA_ID=CAMNT_0022581373 /DNA_START=289 /DNA_END=447 /DNA_ORIENTATION=-
MKKATTVLKVGSWPGKRRRESQKALAAATRDKGKPQKNLAVTSTISSAWICL